MEIKYKDNLIKFNREPRLKNRYKVISGNNAVGKTSMINDIYSTITSPAIITKESTKITNKDNIETIMISSSVELAPSGFADKDLWVDEINTIKKILKDFNIDVEKWTIIPKTPNEYFRDKGIISIRRIIERFPHLKDDIIYHADDSEKLPVFIFMDQTERSLMIDSLDDETITRLLSDDIGSFELFEIMFSLKYFDNPRTESLRRKLLDLVPLYDWTEEHRSKKDNIFSKEANQLRKKGFAKLSAESGYSSGQYRIKDFVEYLVSLNSKINKNGKIPLILIDEIELHLHPSWQKTILETIDACITNAYFIISTHSPIILSSMHKRNILSLPDMAEPRQETFTKPLEWIIMNILESPSIYSKTITRSKDKLLLELIEKVNHEKIE